MPTDRELEHNRLLKEIEGKLDTLILVMDEHPSEYAGVIRTIRDARRLVRSKPEKVLQMVNEAIDMAENESRTAIEYRRIVDGIAPDDPVFNDEKVAKRMAEYRAEIKSGDIKGAEKSVKALVKAIDGRGRAPAITVRMESTRVSRDDFTAMLMVSNVDKRDVILNSVYASTSVWSDDVCLKVPVVRSGDTAQIPIVLGSASEGPVVVHILINYTRDLAPVTQRYDFRVFVE